MALLSTDIKWYLTTGSATGSDFSEPQNDPDLSTGGWCSTTPFSGTLDNLFDSFTEADLLSGTKDRTLCVRSTNTTDPFLGVRVLVKDATLPVGATLTVGAGVFDKTTASPLNQTGVAFSAAYEWTGVDSTDYPLSAKAGPLNSVTGSGDESLTSDSVIFVWFRLSCSSVTSLNNSAFTPTILGFDGGNNLDSTLDFTV